MGDILKTTERRRVEQTIVKEKIASKAVTGEGGAEVH
jgi:hypothetical protein